MSGNERRVDAEVVQTLGIESSTKRAWRRAFWWMVALGAIVGIGFGVRTFRERRARAREPHYETERAAVRDIQVQVSATGTLQGQNTVEVGAEVSGRVARVLVDFNDRVKAGQVLAEIDPEQLHAAADEARARVAAADATTKQARATLAEAKQTAQRTRQQVEEGLVSVREREAAEAALLRAEASVDSAIANAQLARATLKSQLSRLDKTRIVSPIDGMVLSRLVEPGQTVTAGFQTPVLFKLTEDLTRMSLYVYIDEADIGRTKEGQKATFTVDAYPERVFSAQLTSLRNEPKEEQNVVTYEAVLAVDNRDLVLRPGMTATATIVAEVRQHVLAVPNEALRFTPPELPREQTPKPAERGVWRKAADTPKFIPLTLGASDGQWTEVRKGEVRAGTELLVDLVEPEKKR